MELPYSVVLMLTLVGVAYSSITKRSTIGYWEFLAPVTAAICAKLRAAPKGSIAHTACG